MSDPYLGEIRAFAGSYAPEDWVQCDGSMMSVQQNQALFAVLGTTYGGDGVNNFGIPDLRGRIPIGDGQLQPNGQTYPLGARGGVEEVSLTQATIPSHTHTFTVATNQATSNVPTNNYFAQFYDSGNPSFPATPYNAPSTGNAPVDVYWADNAVSFPQNNVAMAHENMQPFITITYIMCINGLFPSAQ